jgi:hypothetical protein
MASEEHGEARLDKCSPPWTPGREPCALAGIAIARMQGRLPMLTMSDDDYPARPRPTAVHTDPGACR